MNVVGLCAYQIPRRLMGRNKQQKKKENLSVVNYFFIIIMLIGNMSRIVKKSVYFSLNGSTIVKKMCWLPVENLPNHLSTRFFYF